jgi:hypothetical protein
MNNTFKLGRSIAKTVPFQVKKQTVEPKRDYGAVAALIYWFTVFGIVTWLTIHVFISVAYGQELELSPKLTENEKEYCESRYGNNITRCLKILDMMTPEERQYCDGSYNEEEYANVICPPFLSKSLELDRQKEGKEPLSDIIRDMKNMSFFAGGTDTVGNQFFSINIPDNWAYTESSNTIEAHQFGYGLLNQIVLTPDEFSETLVNTENDEMVSRAIQASFTQDTYEYRIKNAPLESYVKYLIVKFHISNITSQQYTTIDKEKAVRIYGNNTGQYGDNKILFYIVMHDKEPYSIRYLGNPANFEKYLPEFEKIVKSFKFADSKIELENNTNTNTKTNFSGANVTEFTRNTSDNNDPEELYDECVRVSAKSFCDFLFRK